MPYRPLSRSSRRGASSLRVAAALAAAIVAGAAVAFGAPVTSATPAAAPPASSWRIDFDNASRPAREKEILTRYAEQVARWALIQRIVDAVAAADAKPLSMERIHQIDEAWSKGGNPDGLVTTIMQNDCAQALQSLLASNPGWGEAFVTDSRGANVCMASRTTDYWQGDENKFLRAWNHGNGALFVGDSGEDKSSKLEMIHVSAPVRVRGKVAGVLILGRLMSEHQ